MAEFSAIKVSSLHANNGLSTDGKIALFLKEMRNGVDKMKKDEEVRTVEKEQDNKFETRIHTWRPLKCEQLARRKLESFTAPGTCCRGLGVLVDQLPPDLDLASLRNHFLKYGAVKQVFLSSSGRWGFVVYKGRNVAYLVGSLRHELGGHQVRVMGPLSFRSHPRPHPRIRPRPRPRPRHNKKFDVFLYRVPTGVNNKEIQTIMSSIFGPVVSVTRTSGKTYAFVRFKNEEGQQAALAAGSFSFLGGRIRIKVTVRR